MFNAQSALLVARAMAEESRHAPSRRPRRPARRGTVAALRAVLGRRPQRRPVRPSHP